MGFGIDPATREKGLDALSGGPGVSWAQGDPLTQQAEAEKQKQALLVAQGQGSKLGGMGPGG
jgi:hypothetical protein